MHVYMIHAFVSGKYKPLLICIYFVLLFSEFLSYNLVILKEIKLKSAQLLGSYIGSYHGIRMLTIRRVMSINN